MVPPFLVAINDDVAERPVPPEALAVIDEMSRELAQLAEDVEQRGLHSDRMDAANARMTALSLQLDAIEKGLASDGDGAPGSDFGRDLGDAARERMRPAITRLMTAIEVAQQANAAAEPELGPREARLEIPADSDEPAQGQGHENGGQVLE